MLAIVSFVVRTGDQLVADLGQDGARDSFEGPHIGGG
jgi:hypothetical protein